MFMKSINVEGGYSFCGGWNFSKLVSVDSTFIRAMRVDGHEKKNHNIWTIFGNSAIGL